MTILRMIISPWLIQPCIITITSRSIIPLNDQHGVLLHIENKYDIRNIVYYNIDSNDNIITIIL